VKLQEQIMVTHDKNLFACGTVKVRLGELFLPPVVFRERCCTN